MSVFGPLLPGPTVALAAASTLNTWLYDYIKGVENAAIFGALDRPKANAASAYATLDSHVWLANPLTPRFGVALDDTVSLERGAVGHYIATVPFTVEVIAGARGNQDTLYAGAAYLAAAVGVLLDHPSLGDVIDSLDLTGEGYGEAPTDQDRTLSRCSASFVATVTDFRIGSKGPKQPTPRPDPTVPYPDRTVQDTELVIDPLAPDEENP